MLLRLFVHLAHLFGVDARGLVAKDVQSRTHGVDRDDGVEIVGSLHHHDVDEPGREHILVVFKDLDAFEVFLRPLSALRGNVANGGEFRAFDETLEFGEYLGVERALLAYADNAVSDFVFHHLTSARSFVRFACCHRKTSFRDAQAK